MEIIYSKYIQFYTPNYCPRKKIKENNKRKQKIMVLYRYSGYSRKLDRNNKCVEQLY